MAVGPVLTVNRAAQSDHMRLVETPLRVKVYPGNAFIARAASAQHQARMFAVHQYPGIVFRVVATILQPACSDIYGLLDDALPAFVDAHQQRLAMHGVGYGEMAFAQNAHGM